MRATIRAAYTHHPTFMSEQGFISTQIQGRIDDLRHEEEVRNSIASKFSSLRDLYAQGSRGDGDGDGDGEEQKIASAPPVKLREKPAKKSKKQPKDKKKKQVASITSYVTDSYQAKNIAVLKALSGKKRKINDIIKSIQAIEDDNADQLTSFDEAKTNSTDVDSTHILYNKSEWFQIVKSINLKFPDLSVKTKLPLSAITSKFLKSSEDDNKSASDENTVRQDKKSMWHMASSPPQQVLSTQELCWLYDINTSTENHGYDHDHHQDHVHDLHTETSFDEGSNVNDSSNNNLWTLSQLLKSRTSPLHELDELKPEPDYADDEVANSSAEEETLLGKTISTAYADCFKGISQANPINLSSEPNLSVVAHCADDKYNAEEILVIDSDQDESPPQFYSSAQSDIYYTQPEDYNDSLGIDNAAGGIESTVRIRGTMKDYVSNAQVLKKRKLKDFTTDQDDEVIHITTKKLGISPTDFDEDAIPNSSSEEEEETFIQVIKETRGTDKISIEVASSQREVDVEPTSEPLEADHLDILDQEVASDQEQEIHEEVDDFSKLTIDELKKRLTAWGLKVGKSKARMIETLSQASKLVSQSQKIIAQSQTQTQTQTQNQSQSVPTLAQFGTKQDIFNSISAAVRKDPVLYNKILTFTPLKSHEMIESLQSHEVNLEEYVIKEYCDFNGITIIGGNIAKESDELENKNE